VDQAPEGKLAVTQENCDFEAISNLHDAASKFVDTTLIRAESVRKMNEIRAEDAKWISGFLFTLGWGLGLVGKLYGVPEAAGGD
jgi:hypothetical protein